MSSKRRSTRERTVPSKYFKESSSEDEGDDDKTKAAKLKLKEMMNDDSDQESDFEKEIQDKQITSSDSEVSEVSEDEIKTPKRTNGEKSICLSESDSDADSEDRNVSNKNKTSNGQYQQLLNSQARNHESPDNDDEVNDVDANNMKLLALAGNLQKQGARMWEETQETSKKKSKTSGKVEGKPKKTAKKRKSEDCFETVKKPKPSNSSSATGNSESISQLLAMGEGVDMVENAEADDEEEEEEKAPILPKSGVEVTVPVPEHLRRRKKKEKKEFDVEAFLKRELGKARRENLLLQHRAGLVFQLGHLLHLHHCLSCPSLQCQALSLVPASHSFPPASLTLARLSQFVAWLRETFPVSRHQAEARSVAVVAGLETSLSTLLVMSDCQLVLLFVLTCRALGYRVRLVLNLLTPTKQDSSEDGRKEKQNNKKPLKESPPEDREEVAAKKKSRSEKPTLSSKLAAAASARKSKKLPPSATEEKIVANIEQKSDPTEAEEKKDKRKSRKKAGESSKESGYFPDSKTKQTGSSSKAGSELRYWAEVFLARENRWIPVDVVTGKINNPADIESRAAKPVVYVFAVNNLGGVKDVTRRYSGNFLTLTRKLRTDQTWVADTLSPWLDRDSAREDEELTRKSEEAPLPTNIGAFKGHPLYALQRHLLKFEAIYPPDAPTLGFIRGEGVYARECVHTLQGRTSWLKEGRVVRLGEEPYKVVKARPKWDRMTGAKTAEEPLEVFGAWQTEIYIPPVAVDGKVPRNEYGNVELFKPWMLPGGCVHIPIDGMKR